MSKRKARYDHALLESWRPPREAGEPVGCLSTTYTFDAGIFEERAANWPAGTLDYIKSVK